MIISIIGGVTLIVHQVYKREYEINNFWIFGFLIIIFCYATFLSLHIIRGYYMWCMNGDPASHLGIIKQINTVGHVLQSNFYPLMHIYVAEIQQILDLELIQLHKLIPLYFNLLYVVFMYLFAKSVLPNKGQIILASVASCTLVSKITLNFVPNNMANLIFSMALFILVKSFTTNKIQWKILIIITVLLFPPFHIVTSLALGIILISLWIPKRIFALINKDILKEYNNIGSIDKFNANLSLLLLVGTITWISSFYIWNRTIRRIYITIQTRGITHLYFLIEQVREAEVYQYDVVEYFFKTQAGVLLYIFLTLASIPVLWKEIRINKEIKNLISLYGPFFIFSLFMILFYFFKLAFGPLRMLFYINIICTIFTGFMGYKIIEKIWCFNRVYITKFALGLIVILFVVIFLSGILKLYPSPYILSTNWQTTKTEVEGIDWFFNKRDLQIEMTGITFAPGRFADLLLNPEEKKTQGISRAYLSEDMKAPYHFGYNDQSSLSESYKKDTYLLITEKDKSKYLDVYPEMVKDRWYPSDFDRLENDKTLDKLYDNGEYDMWYIHGKEIY